MKKEFLPFEEVKKFALDLGIKSQREWREFARTSDRPSNIPSSPNVAFKNKGWTSWGEFLGNGNVYKKDFLPFKEARKYARLQNIKSFDEWNDYCKSGLKPDNIPSSPYRIYKDEGWISMGDWLGTGRMSKGSFYSYQQSRQKVIGLGIRTSKEYNKYMKSPSRDIKIPAHPNITYENKGWISWGEFLGTGFISKEKREFLPYEEARKESRSLKLKSFKEWIAYCASGLKPDNIPCTPYVVYKNNGWKNWNDWLGDGVVRLRSTQYKSFHDAREFAISLKLNEMKDWFLYCNSGNKPDDIPTRADSFYRKYGWISWGDFLGTGSIAAVFKHFLPFEEAREFVRTLGLKNTKEWNEYCKSGQKPLDIPSNPSKSYKNKGWIDYGDWIGKYNRCQKEAISFEEIIALHRQNNITSIEEWMRFRKKNSHMNLPAHPIKPFLKKK